jgi:hypothetical protein
MASDGIYRKPEYSILRGIRADGDPIYRLWRRQEYMDWEGGIGCNSEMIAQNEDVKVLEKAIEHLTAQAPPDEYSR